MPKTFNWGIIATGNIAHKFAQDVALIPDAQIHAVASRSFDKASDFAQQYGAQYAYGSYESIVQCPDLDAVYVATPHSLHYENTMHCLKHKIPVLCEKSFAINARQVGEMIATANANDTFLMEAFWTRFLPTHRKMYQLIQEGAIGDIRSIKADFGIHFPFKPEGRLFNRSLGGGSLLDVGIYPVFLAVWLLGKPTITKAVATFGPTEVEEVCNIIFKYDTGQTAILDSSLRFDTPCIGYIYGSEGYIQLHHRFHEARSFSIGKYGQEPTVHQFEFTGNGYFYEAIEVMERIRSGKTQSALMPLSLSLDLMETLDSIRSNAGIVYPEYD